MNAPLDSFETALLAQLRDHVDHQQGDDRPGTSRRRHVWLSAAAVAVVATAVVVVVPQLGTEAAYSVQEGNTGIITVEVRRPEDAAGLESALKEYGITADITYVPHLQECAPGRYVPVDRRLSGMQVTIGAERLSVTLPPGTVRDGETFVMWVSGEVIPPKSEPNADGTWDLEGYSASVESDVTAGEIRPCEVVPSRIED